ncbi:MAG TPA: hypothetical protein VHW01_18040 [Polyangiaceae bacterium]|nr:hypothetical protein [Polyangiaceae bacterium]
MKLLSVWLSQALTHSVLSSACAAWDIDPERCRLVGDFENFVYEAEVRAMV